VVLFNGEKTVSSIKEQLNTLVELQDAEMEIQHLEKELARIEVRVNAMLSEQTAFEQKVQDSRNTIDDLKKQYRSDESEIKDIDSQITKSKEKLRSVKTNKEYQSTLKEIDDLKNKSSQIEDRMLENLERIESEESEIVEKMADLEDVKREVAGKQEEIRTTGEQKRQNLDRLVKERDAIVSTMEDKLTALYHKVKRQSGGIAMAAVVETICQQCRMNIPPQQFNELMRLDSMRLCPHCQRIMYPKDVLFDEGTGLS
jgi:predicted  nucleic acid-binding Zn-ribbon protein